MHLDSIQLPSDLKKLETFIQHKESAHNLKDGTQARIVWQSTRYQKTEYAVVYLHGFRASHPEGDPVHKTIAAQFGCNLYLSRIEEHGIKSDYPLLDLTTEKMLKSAQFALEVGRKIGKKVILMGTSTGASLALYLASREAYQKDIASLILYSPLVAFYGFSNSLLTHSWSRNILRVVPGRNYLISSKNSTFAEDKVWNKHYALGGALSLGQFVQYYMVSALFRKITLPTFVGYYYKNKKEQDTVVSVPAIKKMTTQLGTRTNQLMVSNFPEAKSHVICSSLVSKAVPGVIDNTIKFLKTVGAH